MQHSARAQSRPRLAPPPWGTLAGLVRHLELGNEALLCLSEQRRVILNNPGAERLFRVGPAALCDQALSALLLETEPGILRRGFRQLRQTACPQTHDFPKGALRARQPSGLSLPLEGSLSRLSIGPLHGFTLVLRDISEQVRQEERLHYLATHDNLTGLPNRLALVDRLESAIQRHRRQRSRFALVFIDLDGFKPINDRYGHGTGDAVLRACAERLKTASRGSDVVARIGGDEFVVLVEQLTQAGELERVCQRLVAFLTEQPIRVGPDPIPIQASLGCSEFPRDGETPDQLLGRADEVMYIQKRVHHHPGQRTP